MRIPLGRNWGLKILALALAIIIYYTLKHEASNPHGLHEANDRHIFQTSR